MSEDLRTEELEAALNMIQRRINQTASSCGRDPNAITLVAASKTVDSTRLQQAIDSGQRVFGENRVQEARQKWPALRKRNPSIELHLLGPLQSNKARDAVELFDVIQSVDSEKLARVIARECERTEVSPSLLIQVNTSREPQKGGVMAENVDALVRLCRDELRLDVRGLMCIPAATADPSADFRLLRSLAADNGLSLLSMGMSGDFPIAILEGATHVRVGSAIFGARSPKP